MHGRLAVGWAVEWWCAIFLSVVSEPPLLCARGGFSPVQIKLSSGLQLNVVFLLLNDAQKGCVARPYGLIVLLAFWQSVSHHLCLQANGSAKKAGGDCKPTSPSLPASKIPALSPSSGKSSSLPSASGDSSNLPNAPATKPSIASTPLSPQAGRSAHSASLIPSVSNGSLKFQSPPHAGKGHHHLSFALQTQNGRAAPTTSSSSSPPSPASPTSLNQGARGIRTIHTPSLASYKAQNGSSSKATPSTAKETS